MPANNLNFGALFNHYPWVDNATILRKVLHPEKGPHFFYRLNKAPCRAMLHKLIDYTHIPRAFLFGSPHIDNYAKTDTGCGMIDFDRAYVGPYLWDLTCLILSVSLRQQEHTFTIISDAVFNALLDGYSQGLTNPNEAFQTYQPIADSKPKEWQLNISAYVSAGKKWAKKLNQYPIPANDPLIQDLLQQYLTNLKTPIPINEYQILQAACCNGTLGRTHYIILAQHLDQSLRLIDIKHTRSYHNNNWPHDQFYSSDFKHDGQRMIAASELHAPGVTSGESYAKVNGIQYWGRSVPLQNKKIKMNLSHSQQLAFCYAVGTQLGRSHALSGDKTQIRQHLAHHKDQLFESCNIILHQLEQGWLYYQEIESFR